MDMSKSEKSKRQSDLKNGFEAVGKLADAKNVILFWRTDVISERELLARKTVLFERRCQYLDHRSVDNGINDGTRRHSCLCQRFEIAKETELAVKSRSWTAGRLAEDTVTLMSVLEEARSANAPMIGHNLLLS